MLVVFFASCSNDIINDDVVESRSSVENKFLASVDSLNDVYLKTANTRATLSQSYLVKPIEKNPVSVVAADAVGAIAGKVWGPRVGMAIGSVTGNPWGTIAGGLLGRRYGSAIFSSVFSFVAEKYNASTGLATTNTTVKPGFVVVSNNKEYCTIDDSLGYIHNQVMSTLSNNKKNYWLPNNELNFNMVYDDCVACLRDLGYYDESLAADVNLKEAVVTKSKAMATLTRSCYLGQISAETMLEKSKKLVDDRLESDKEDTELCFELVKKVVVVNKNMTLAELQRYSSELSNIIQESNCSVTTKTNLNSTANVALNSSICWLEQ